MAVVQLDFFEQTETSILKAKIEELEDKLDRQRKSQFAKIGAQEKRIVQLEESLTLLIRNICQTSCKAQF